MIKNKKLTSVLLAALFSVVLSGNTAFAAEGDVYDLTTKQIKYQASVYTTNASEFLKFKQGMIFGKTNLGYEHNGKVYKGTDLLAKPTKTVGEFSSYLVELENNSNITKLLLSDFMQTTDGFDVEVIE